MSMKKILMAAVAVTALTAGSANAITIATTTTVGGQTLAPTSPVSGTTSDPYTLANEITTPASTTVTAVVVSTLATPLAAATPYIVTYEITNGTFVTTGIGTTDVTVKDNQATPVTNTLSATANGTVSTSKVQYIFTAAATTGGSVSADNLPKTLSWASQGIKPLSTKLPVKITASIALLSSPTVAIDGGVSPEVTLVDFRDSVGFTATAANPKLSIASTFKKFVVSGAADATSANIATSVGVTLVGAPAAGVGAGTNDKIFKNGSGTALAATDVATATLTIGGDLSKLDVRLGAAQLADTGTTNVITADATNLGLLAAIPGATPGGTLSLVNKSTALAATESAYTVTPVITLASGLTAPTFTAKTIGSVTYEGNTFYAAWLADGVGASGFKNTIRLGNRSTTNTVSSVKVQLTNPYNSTATGGSTTVNGICELGTIKPAEELLITSAKLVACFGAFGRSDVKVIVQGNKSDLSAKLRITSPDGSASDTAMGTGISDALENYSSAGF